MLYAIYYITWFMFRKKILSWWTGRDLQNYTYWHGIKGINDIGCACADNKSCFR